MFVVLEGPKATGKTTLVKLLAKKLRDDGYEVVETSEPNEDFFTNITDYSEILKSRKKHVKRRIRPALKEGKIVICSRFYYSTVVYQGSDNMDWVIRADHRNEIGLYPDVLIYLSAPLQILIERRMKRKDTFSLTEIQEEIALYNMIQQDPVNADRDINDILDECYIRIGKKLIEERNE